MYNLSTLPILINCLFNINLIQDNKVVKKFERKKNGGRVESLLSDDKYWTKESRKYNDNIIYPENQVLYILFWGTTGPLFWGLICMHCAQMKI